jgi:uncharacterized membrane protein YciS (DUF1049 family)
MSADRTQTYANHRRFFALYHYIALPIVSLNVVYTAFLVFREPNVSTIWTFVFAIGVASGVLAARTMVLIVQNRVIRLEQRLRMVALLPDHLRGRIVELNLSQLIGLRFAADTELAPLVERCLAGELKNSEDVKRAIGNWQADFLRA